MPAAPHQALSKVARTTNPSERCNNTLRQRVSRRVRDALSLSKTLAKHIGAITLFIAITTGRKLQHDMDSTICR